MKFGWKQYYRPLPKPLQQLLSGLRVFIGAVAVSSYVTEHETRAFWLLVAGAALEFILNFFAEAPTETLEKTCERLERDKPELQVKVHINEKEQEA